MTSPPTRFSRRAFTAATGLSLAFLPILEADRTARAAPSDDAKLVCVVWPNGVRAGHWWPDHQGPNADFELNANSGVTETNFSLAGLRMSEPLEAHRSNLLFFRYLGLANRVEGGHESLPELLKVNNDNTLDQHVARNHSTLFRTLNLAVQKRDNRAFSIKDGQAVNPEQDPYKVFDNLFQSSGLDRETITRQRAGKRSVLDYVGKQLERLGSILGSEDRQRVAFHLTSIRALEKRLDAGGMQTIGGAPASLTEPRFDPQDVNNFHLATRAQFDLIVLALASGATRVATLQLSDGDGNSLATPWLGPDFALNTGIEYLGIRNSHHSHGHVIDAIHSEMQRWFVSEFAEFINKLKNTTSVGGRPLLDESMVLVMNNMNTGGGHGTSNLPTFVAGSGNGYFRTGRYLRYSEFKTNQNGLLAGIANAMGTPVAGLYEFAELRG